MNAVQFVLMCHVWVNLVWGIFNLLPLYPMDGGQILSELLTAGRPGGRQAVHVVSIVTATVLGVLAIIFGQYFVLILVAYFGYINWQALQHGGMRSRW